MTFNGFISYSHAADGRLAPAIQRGLHRLAKPWHRRRALWVFRDQTGLSVTPGLWTSIQEALDRSEYFVLLASPEAARSQWVNREISHWVDTKSVDRILPVVTDGEWQWDPVRGDFTDDSTAVPTTLRGVFTEEPLYLDLRWARNEQQVSLRHSRFRDAIAQLAAPMHGLSKDDLEGEDVRQHRRAQRLRAVAGAALMLLTAVALVTGAWAVHSAERANAQTREAQRQRVLATEQQTKAELSAAEVARQEALVREQEGRARAAADETRRQEKLTSAQQVLARDAAAQAREQQAIAARQSGRADQAAARAAEQERLALRSAAEARKQQELAREQKRLALKSADEAAKFEKAAKEQQARAEKAAEQARRDQAKAKKAAEQARTQEANAEQQKRIAVGRRLINQAKATIERDPKTALMLGAAAQQVSPSAETRRELAGVVTSTHYAGTLDDAIRVVSGPGGVVAVQSKDRVVSLWDVSVESSPVRFATLEGANSWGQPIAFSPDGRLLALARGSEPTILWDLTNKAKPKQLVAWTSGSTRVAFSPDGATLASSDDKNATLWDLTDPAEPKALSTIHGPTGEVSFGPGGRTMVTHTDDSVTVWDIRDRTDPDQQTTLDLGDVSRSLSVLNPGSPVLATSGNGGAVTLWDMTNPARPQRGATLSTPDMTSVTTATFSPNGRILAVGDSRGTATMWDVEDFSHPLQLAAMPGQDGSITSMAFSADTRALITVGNLDMATVWNVAKYGGSRLLADLPGYTDRVVAMAYGPTGQTLATVNDDGKVLIWDVSRPGRPVRRAALPIDSGWITAATFTSDGRVVAVADAVRQQVKVVDVTNPDQPKVLTTLDEVAWLDALAFSPDGRTLAMSESAGVSLWGVTGDSRPARLSSVPGNTVFTGSVVFSPDGSTLAIGGHDRKVVLWDVSDRFTPSRPRTLTGHNQPITSIAFSPDGQTLATGSSDETAVLWDLSEDQPYRVTAVSLPSAIHSVAFSDDGATLATGTDNNMVALWDIAERAAPIRLTTVTRKDVHSRLVLFSPDGHTLATGGSLSNYGVTIWDFATLKDLRADPGPAACVIARRGLTNQEWSRYIPEFAHRSSCDP